ncbi:MAG: glycosyltransferase [Candidatus Schekmanbacteria bacterium]|nr:MAG: glycosyltransferase [Candidatus Schekmanbacteria bacterium]
MPEFNKEDKMNNNEIAVSVIVCTYNRAESFKKFLESFFSQDGKFPDCEFLIVDNNSTDNTRQVCEEYLKSDMIQVRYIHEKQQGLSYARNTSVKNARGKLLAFIDDDVVVDRKWLQMVRKLVDEYPEYIAMGGKVVPIWEKGKPPWAVFEGKYAIIQSVFPSHDYGNEVKPYPIRTQKNPMGACMMIRREAFEKYGLFRTDLGVSGASLKTGGLHEDTEFIWRMLAHGEKALYYPKAVVSHFVPESRSSKKYIKQWYFKSGASFTRMKHNYYDRQEYVRFFGIPRWLFKKFIKPAFWLLFAVNKEKRFFYHLRFYRLLGTLAEFFNHKYEMLKKKGSPPQSIEEKP